MNKATLIMLALAGVSLAGAYSMRPVELPPPVFEDTGELLAADFQDPAAAAGLEVKQWDKESASLRTFAVELRDGKWLIPSHNDYPADGAERMGKAAASFVGVKRDQYRGDDAKEHEAFGVQDPEDAGASDDGKGQRVTLKDASGTVLVDVIVGKKVEGKDGYRYLREASSDRVYASKIDLDVSTEFTDWIEKDLLKLKSDEVMELTSAAYRVDEGTGRVVDHEPLVFRYAPKVEDPVQREWALIDGIPTPKGKELDPSKVSSLIGAATRIKIAGVRPQPQMLTDVALQSKGFFLSPDMKRLFGNEGELRLKLADGVVYTLYFGEITYDQGLALTAGGGEEGKGKEGDDGAKANRYMFVNVTFEPPETPAPDAQGEGAPAPDPEAGQKHAEELRKRFSKWFYVIPDSAFTQVRKDNEHFFKDAS